MIERFELSNENETRELGKNLANRLNHQPALIFLRGDLGLGKTTLAQGFIKALIGNDGPIQSPTFAYMHSYPQIPSMPIYHFDLYRIEEENTLYELGLDLFINDEHAIRLIEWPERMGTLMKKPDIDIELIKHRDAREAIVSYFSQNSMDA